MALLHVNFFSDVLGMAVSADVILPEESKNLIGMKTAGGEIYRTLYLLHGLSDDQTIWQRRTSVERYVAGRNMAVVMPTTFRAWYTDMKMGGKYLTYISEELPRVMRSFFRGMSDRREDNFIAGLSMGGYGAVKIALLHPERFLGAASFSGVLDIGDFLRRRVDDAHRAEYEAVFGDLSAVPGSEYDIATLARQAAGAPQRPSLYLWCGTEDPFYAQTKHAGEYLPALGYTVDYHESAGTHAWEYWDRELPRALEYFDSLRP